jgi:outer membrane protein OmpA-like peptidoglycan-associated protein/Tol biopolymer transport system component
MPAPINSLEYLTIAPHISYDGTRVVFVMETDGVRELAECKKNIDGTWAGPFRIDAVNHFDSVKFVIDAPSYNDNASAIYFSLKYVTKNANANLYVTKKTDGEWTKPERLPAPVNSPDDETDPFITADGNFLFFAKRIQNEENKNNECYKLYVSENKNGVWQKPLPLPEPVNAGCDRMPRIAPDGKTLYFSSIRGANTNDFKLHYAKKITKNAWTSPILIDSALIKSIELFPTISADGKELFFMQSSEVDKKTIEKFVSKPVDFMFQPEKTVRVNGIVSDLKTDNPLNCKIDIIDPNTSIVLFQTETDGKTGSYSFFIPFGRKYLIDVYKPDYSHYFFGYDAEKLTEYKDFNQNIKLYPEIDLIVNVSDNEIYEPLKSELAIYDFETKEKVYIPVTEIGTGRYSLILPIGRHYTIEAGKKHFDTNQFDLDLRGVVQFSEFERDLELQVKKVDYVIQLQDAVTGEGVEAMVEIINLSTNERIVKQEKTDNEGKLNIKLRDGEQYEINITPQGYSFYNTTVDLMDESADYVKEVKLTPLREETKIELNDINFETNSADLNKSSFEELDRLVKLLFANPNLKIEISAHTDDVGSDTYNLKLSDRRAESVKEYLFMQSITIDRIVSKGYGESKPAYLPADSDENRAKNRRVELKVLQI